MAPWPADAGKDQRVKTFKTVRASDALQHAKPFWHRYFGSISAELETILDGVFTVAKTGLPLRPIFQRNHPSWETDAVAQEVLLKVLADMAGFTIFIGAPFNAISHLWKDTGWDTARLRAAMGPGWYRRLVLPNLLTNYFVWFPGTLIFYSMPTDLQLVVANCIGCFWALMCARIAAHSGVPTTDVHA